GPGAGPRRLGHTWHLPSPGVVACLPTQRHPRAMRLWTLRPPSRVATRPPSPATPTARSAECATERAPYRGHWQLHEKSRPGAFLVRKADRGQVVTREAVVKEEHAREFSWSCTPVQVFRMKLPRPEGGEPISFRGYLYHKRGARDRVSFLRKRHRVLALRPGWRALFLARVSCAPSYLVARQPWHGGCPETQAMGVFTCERHSATEC